MLILYSVIFSMKKNTNSIYLLLDDNPHLGNCPVHTRSNKKKYKRCDCTHKIHENSCKRRRANKSILSPMLITSQENVDALTESLKALSPSQKPSVKQDINTTPKFNRKAEIDSLTQSFKHLSPADKPSTSKCFKDSSTKVEKRMEIQTLTQRLNEYSSNKDTSLIREIKEVPTFKRRAEIEAYERLIENSKKLEEANISGISLILPDDLMSDCGKFLSDPVYFFTRLI